MDCGQVYSMRKWSLAMVKGGWVGGWWMDVLALARSLAE